ncbi:MAG TPA: AAA family ATPase [Streptosporangiaceae bacterium]|jgi:DNA-binding CsgD family transcriptional regulator|nr:AAA family ATPase [Streptosporangiaceae bacterium]
MGSGGHGAELRAPRLVDRDAEVARIIRALAHPPAVVLIEGEPGIGKTRLVQEALAAQPAGGRGVLLAVCPPFRQPYTLGAVVDAVRRAAEVATRPGGLRGLRLSGLAGALRPLFPEWAGELPPALEPAEDATAARHRLFRALAELLAGLRVTVLVIEDVHWADEATLEFLLFLAARGAPGLSLVATHRREDTPASSLLWRLPSRLPAGVTQLRLELGPLGVDATAALVSSMVDGQPVSQKFAGFLHRSTEGVPLAIEESVRLMADRDDLTRSDGEWIRRSLDEIVVPPTVRDAVLERAGRLTADAQAVLRAAAVLAAPADEATLAAVAGLPDGRSRAALTQALACGLLAEDGRLLVSFRHALAAQAVYEATAAPDRRAMHRRCGEALESTLPLPLARLARHFREAGQTARWCRYGEQAADTALASGDGVTASDLLYDLVTEAGPPTADVARLIRKIPFTSLAEPARYRNLAGVLEAILGRGGLGAPVEAELRSQLSRVLVAMSDWVAGRAEIQRAVAHLDHDPAEAARAMIYLGWPLEPALPASAHRRWLRRAATVMASLPAPRRAALAMDRAAALLMLGEQEGWAEAARIPANAPTAGERLQVARGNLNVGDQAMVWGRYAEARQRLAAALELAQTHEYPRVRAEALTTGLHLDWFTGAWQGLLARAAAIADGGETIPPIQFEAVLVTGLLHAAAGRPGQAEDRLRFVIGEISRRGAVQYFAEPAGALARLWLADGRAGDALAITEEPVAVVAGKGIWVWATEIAPARTAALIAAGRVDAAAALVQAFARGLRGRVAPGPKAALALCRALLAEARGTPARAATSFARAAAAWQALPRPYEALLARERQAGCLLAAGSADAALALLAEVHQGLSSLGADGDAGRVARSLRGQGVQVPQVWRGGQRGYGGRLSPRELEVVRFVSQGRTNREIAEALCRSPNTVDTQLRSAMRKLNVTTRTALAVKAIELKIHVSG